MGNIGPVQARYEVLPTVVPPAQPLPRPAKLRFRLVRLIRRDDARV